jgi:hypothetical protein
MCAVAAAFLRSLTFTGRFSALTFSVALAPVANEREQSSVYRFQSMLRPPGPLGKGTGFTAH